MDSISAEFITQVKKLKLLTGMKNRDLAKLYGCSEVTISKLQNDPGSVSGKYILMTQRLLQKEEGKI